ncbi:VIT1/CCC1 transporter family protein [Brevundimonas sp. SL130]|uniref:VIT1/CCC1 transporter family protein n=1 Tax=Brevundimonas sp. SL130 TaxID=2995143 RepID=UPI00226D0D8A|nr:VIT family protein [Brevundimonas sp. SL130]WAC59083.1 VIT family protein [Brevundimonas sp. SL130]
MTAFPPRGDDAADPSTSGVLPRVAIRRGPGSGRHDEHHLVRRIGWLRAAVLGANDGLVSTASLIVGIAAAGGSKSAILVAGGAGLVAGAMSMAAGEYVSVSSQADTEKAELARESQELREDLPGERAELTAIYVGRGLEPDLASAVADQLMRKDALGAHARDELGISDLTAARPIQAALTSAATFASGAILPLLVAWAAPRGLAIPILSVATLVFLGGLGAAGALTGHAPLGRAVVRVVFWGAFALGVTAGAGALFGAAV